MTRFAPDYATVKQVLNEVFRLIDYDFELNLKKIVIYNNNKDKKERPKFFTQAFIRLWIWSRVILHAFKL